MKLLSLTLLGLGQGTKSGQSVNTAVSHNGNGTGGSVPAIRHYVAANGPQTLKEIGIGPHAADGILSKDGGYVSVGVCYATATTEVRK